jgi:putative drug exporter of the RND superfamily
MRIDAVFGVIGRFAVRFRWLVLLAWVAAAIGAATQLPSLGSVTQSNNIKFLPASAPSEHAAQLAAPFGTAGLQPIPVVAARASAPLRTADLAAMNGLQQRLAAVSGVSKVLDAGVSPDGHAEQLVVLASGLNGGNPATAPDLVDALRARIASSGLPAGLQVHLAGTIAAAVDQQKASGSTGNRIELLSVLFIIVLLVLIFRSLTLALTTLAPALLSFIIAGPLVGEAAEHGLQVSSLAQFLMIVLVLGAGTDYGLFLVFRVREELRSRQQQLPGERYPGSARLPGSLARDLTSARPPAREAIVWSVTKVGESISFSGATVIAAMLTLLLASFSFYSGLGAPFAIAIGVMLISALTLLPAMLSIRLSLVEMKRTLFCSLRFWPLRGRPKLLPWTIQGSGGEGVWGRVAGRIVRYPVPTLLAGVVFFGGLGTAVLGYTPAGFGGTTAPPAGSDSAAGQALLNRHFPQSAANPTSLIFLLRSPAWADPGPLATATAELRATGLFRQVTGPLNPAGAPLTPASYAALYRALGPAKGLPLVQHSGVRVPLSAYQAYRATANYVSPDGRTVQYSTSLTAGDPGSTAAMNAVPSVRAATASVARSIGAADSAVGGEAPALVDISNISDSDLQHIVPIAILAIGILLALVLRSLVAPLYLIASVGISYLAALGLSVLIFIKIGSSGGLVFFMPFLMFIFLLALGEDYNILVMTRIREEAHSRALRDAVARALARTGTTVTSAGLVLAGTFLVLTVAAGSSNIGLGLALGVLMDTFLVRTLLVPSTVVLLGRWNWWPSRMSRPAAPPVSAPEPAVRAVAAEPATTAEPQDSAVPAEPAAAVAREPDPLS